MDRVVAMGMETGQVVVVMGMEEVQVEMEEGRFEGQARLGQDEEDRRQEGTVDRRMVARMVPRTTIDSPQKIANSRQPTVDRPPYTAKNILSMIDIQ